MGMRPGLDRQEVAGPVFGRFRIWIELFFRSKPVPLAGYPDVLVTLTQWHQQLRTVTSGLYPGPNWPVAKLAVRVVNKREPSTQVRFNGKLPAHLDRAGF